MRLLVKTLVTIALMVLSTNAALSHRSNESYVYFDVTDESLSGRFEATLADLDAVFDLDTDGNGSVEESEFLAASERIFSEMASRLSLSLDGTTFELEPGPVTTLDAGQVGIFGILAFRVPGLVPVPDEITVLYEPLSEAAPNHAGFILISSNTRVGMQDNEAYVSLTFSPGDDAKVLSLVGEPWLTVFKDFVVHGIWHIWLGFDHVVFLITLLLPSVMMAVGSKWMPLDQFRSAFWNVTKIVTVFTLSHSVTLTLAGLGLVRVPVDFVEVVIAASIIAVALMNMFPPAHRYILWVVFIFGLFHGFGFANVLAPLALDPSRRIVGILAFNVGVEIGQLAIVIVVFPLLWMLRRWRLYPFLAFKAGTVALVLLAGVWFLERTTDFEFNARGAIASITGVQL